MMSEIQSDNARTKDDPADEEESTKKHKKKDPKHRRKLELLLAKKLSASSLLTFPFKKKKSTLSRSADSVNERLPRNNSDPNGTDSGNITEGKGARHHRSNPNIPSKAHHPNMEKVAEFLSFGIIKSPRGQSAGSPMSPAGDTEDPDASDDKKCESVISPRLSEQSGRSPSEIDLSTLPDLVMTGRRPDVKRTFTPEMAELVREHLPVRLRLVEQWRLLYSMEQHGTSLATLYRAVAGKWALVIAVKDTDGSVFGAFVPQPLQPRSGYYGNGECFLWTMKCSSGCTTGLRTYTWTGKNDYFMMSEPEYFGIGGGNGKYGLCLDSSFFRGSSSPCPTFDNEILTGNEEEFECEAIEVWGIPINAFTTVK